jgi:hypothetical protein
MQEIQFFFELYIYFFFRPLTHPHEFLQNTVGRPIIAARKIHFTIDGKQSEAKVSKVSKMCWDFVLSLYFTAKV